MCHNYLHLHLQSPPAATRLQILRLLVVAAVGAALAVVLNVDTFADDRASVAMRATLAGRDVQWHRGEGVWVGLEYGWAEAVVWEWFGCHQSGDGKESRC